MKNKSVALVAGLSVVSAIALASLLEPQGESMRAPASLTLPQNYESLGGCQKQEILWKQIENTEHQVLPPFEKFGGSQVAGLVKDMFMKQLGLKGQLFSDEAPPQWKKYIHARGAVAKVAVVPRSSKFTGIFAGAECGLLRLSLTYQVTDKRPVAPGLALKVLRDGYPSANVSALVSLSGQGKDFNFLKNPMSNIVPIGDEGGQKLIHWIFNQVSRFPEELQVSDMAAVGANGLRVNQMVSPRQIFFVPSAAIAAKISSFPHDVREDFKTIPSGKVLYRIYAANEALKTFDYTQYRNGDVKPFLQNAEYVADLVTTSPFLASEYGDSRLFFRHQMRY